jgi:hypothetical protein
MRWSGSISPVEHVYAGVRWRSGVASVGDHAERRRRLGRRAVLRPRPALSRLTARGVAGSHSCSLGACGGRGRAVITVDSCRFRCGHRSVFCRRARAGVMGRLHNGVDALRSRSRLATYAIFRERSDPRIARIGLRGGDVESQPHCAWRAIAAGLYSLNQGLRRNPRGARTHRPFRAARHRHGDAARAGGADARAAVGQEDDRAQSWPVRCVESAAAAAFACVASGRI